MLIKLAEIGISGNSPYKCAARERIQFIH